ncbi:hypothetical protein [Paenibacillus sp. GCM10027626]|uniref:hypothetical protein n=1 Tax=Paenibacillus sp. GCM10027626 TaxID=3273411 RepID=UPI00363569FF
MDTTATIIFIIVSFSLGLIVIMQRDRVPAQLRRFVAISSIFFIAFAFFLIVYSLATMNG